MSDGQDFIVTVTNLDLGQQKEVRVTARSPERAAFNLCRRKWFRNWVLSEAAMRTVIRDA